MGAGDEKTVKKENSNSKNWLKRYLKIFLIGILAGIIYRLSDLFPYDSRYSEYPFLLRNDITYMPMTYDFSTFMGINITFDEGVNNVYHRGEMILHIGNAKRTSEQLGQYKKTTSNNSVYDAVIPTYHTYISYTDNEYNIYA